MAKERFITPTGFGRIRAEYDQLFGEERPKLVETISWAAANGDRSENGDYIYGRKKLREIDRRLGYLAKVMKEAKQVDPASRAPTSSAGSSASRSSKPAATSSASWKTASSTTG